MLSLLIGILIICVVGAICFWAIDKFKLLLPAKHISPSVKTNWRIVPGFHLMYFQQLSKSDTGSNGLTARGASNSIPSEAKFWSD